MNVWVSRLFISVFESGALKKHSLRLCISRSSQTVLATFSALAASGFFFCLFVLFVPPDWLVKPGQAVMRQMVGAWWTATMLIYVFSFVVENWDKLMRGHD